MNPKCSTEPFSHIDNTCFTFLLGNFYKFLGVTSTYTLPLLAAVWLEVAKRKKSIKKKRCFINLEKVVPQTYLRLILYIQFTYSERLYYQAQPNRQCSRKVV